MKPASWKKVDDSCIVCGKYRIFKYTDYFELWEYPKFIGRFDDAGDARNAMLDHIKSKGDT